MVTQRDTFISRRALLVAAAAAVSTSLLPKSARADREYPNVGFLGGGDKIDINNANVRAYFKFRGFYPNLAGMIVSNGPYKSVDELYDLPGLTESQRQALDKYKDRLVALDPAPEYVVDRVNNGLYK